MPTPDIESFSRELLSGFAPKIRLCPNDWSEANRRMEPGASKRGRWRSYPFQVQPLNDISDPSCSRITLNWASQFLGKSAIITSIVGYFMSEDPASVLLVEPTETAASHFIRSRLNPMIETTASLSGIIDTGRSRKGVSRGLGGQQLLRKSYPGGWFLAGGSSSPAQLRAHAARVTIFDETDAFEQHKEGSTLILVRQRSASFPNALSISASTPTFKDNSIIESEYELGNRCRWIVPCAYCGSRFHLMFTHIVWEKDRGPDGKTVRHRTDTAHIACPCCSHAWSEQDRINAVTSGEWVPQSPDIKSHRSYWLNAFNVLLPKPNGKESWCHEFADRFLEARGSGTAGMQTWQNLVCAESWEVESERPPEYQRLYNRREQFDEFNGEVIADSKILILTAGVDLQSDRAEVTIVGWGEGDEAWVLGHYRVYGDPHGGLFNQVDGILRKRFRHASGHWMHAERVLVDSGNDSKNVYDYVFRCAPRKVFASKGTRGYSPVFVKQSEGQNRRLFIIKIDTPKQNLYNRLRLDSPGIGYVHLPSNPSSGVDLAYCKQLVSETMRWQYTRGQRIPYFELPSGAKNESLDCFVYSMAARQLEDIDVPSVRAWLDSPPDADCDWLARSGTDDTTAVNEAASEPSDLNDALAHLDRVLEKINLK